MKPIWVRTFTLLLGAVTAPACAGPPVEPDSSKVSQTVVVQQQWERWWNTENELSSPRFQHTATLLLDGTVLLVGGAHAEASYELASAPREIGVGQSPLATADVYDPQAARFEPVGPLAEARWGHSATLLRDGQVLVLGGFDAQQRALDSAEIYEPDARAFRPFGRLNHARGVHTATLLADERVLVLGGIVAADDPQVVSEMEACLPDSLECVELGKSSLLAPGHAAVLRSGGQVDVVSPPTDDSTLPMFARFDPSADELERTEQGGEGAPVPEPVPEPAPPPRPFEESHGTNALLRIRPQTGLLEDAWFVGLRAPPTWAARQGRWFNVGGLEEFFPQGGIVGTSFEEPLSIHPLGPGPSMNRGRAWPSVTSLPDGSLLAAGGVLRGPMPNAERLPPPLPQTELVDGLGEVAGPAHAATLLDDGRLLFTGGWERPTSAQVAAFRIKAHVNRAFPNPEVRADLLPLGRLAVERALHQAIALPDGKVLLAGGKTRPEDANEGLFDVGTGKTTDLGVRLHHRTAGVHAGGSRFVFAGARGASVLEGPDFRERAIELPEGPDCETPNVLRLANGHVLIAGKRTLFEVDPGRAELIRATPRPSPRCLASATLLHDGKVFLAGGTDDEQVSLRAPQSAEVSPVEALSYDPKDGSLLPLPDLPWAVLNAAAFSDGLDRVTLATGDLGFSFLLVCDVRGEGTVCRDLVDPPPFAARAPSYTRLPFGGVLSASSLEGSISSLWIRHQPQRLALPEAWQTEPLDVTIGEEITLSVQFSKTWPEHSGGTSNGSAANAPVPVWIPTVGGVAATGTFTRWSADSATWRVPHTAFPGLGTLFYSLAGELYPLRMAWISGLEPGGSCGQGGECSTGYCADGVCCDSPCEDACHACSARSKGHGHDGKCEAVVDGAEDEAACGRDEPSSCRRNGLCDAAGQCASYPEGTVCGEDGATCNAKGDCRAGLGGRTCDADNNSVLGEDEIPCGKYVCASSTGECLTTCTSNVDCWGDNVCSGAGKVAECRPRLATTVTRTSVGCTPGCRVSRPSEDRRALLASLAVGLMLFCRRRARPTSLSAP